MAFPGVCRCSLRRYIQCSDLCVVSTLSQNSVKSYPQVRTINLQTRFVVGTFRGGTCHHSTVTRTLRSAAPYRYDARPLLRSTWCTFDASLGSWGCTSILSILRARGSTSGGQTFNFSSWLMPANGFTGADSRETKWKNSNKILCWIASVSQAGIPNSVCCTQIIDRGPVSDQAKGSTTPK